MIDQTWFIPAYAGVALGVSLAAGIGSAWLQSRGSVKASDGSGPAFSYARASSDLDRCLHGLDLRDAVFEMLGGDGEYICLNGRMLKRVMSKWIEAGARIEYTLTSPSQDANKLFLDFAETVGNDKFQLFTVSALPQKYKKYRTFHPSLITFADGTRAMWIEGHHPPKSSIAYDVKFISKEEMNSSEVRVQQFLNFQEHIKDINSLTKISSSKIAA